MSNPQPFRPSMVILSEDETQRVNRFIAQCGTMSAAQRRLGISDTTFDAARGYGRMLATTRGRVLAALNREEAKLAEEKASGETWAR